jgi:uncharacterized protein YfaQ (DUF2300 family)
LANVPAYPTGLGDEFELALYGYPVTFYHLIIVMSRVAYFLKLLLYLSLNLWFLAGGHLKLAHASQLPHWDKGKYVPTLVWNTNTGVQISQPGRKFNEVETNSYQQALVPLGSTWKLFIYAYLVETQAAEKDYICSDLNKNQGEEYCCLPGARINRDTALAQSCGAYFSAKRLLITQEKWQRWLDTDFKQAPGWLHNIAQMQASTLVPVNSLLQVLEDLPVASQVSARNALIKVNLQTGLATTLADLGTGVRLKTWSWFDQKNASAGSAKLTSKNKTNTTPTGPRIGGAVGWLPNGRAFWWGAAGTSKTSLLQHHEWIAKTLQLNQLDTTLGAWQNSQACVQLKFFNAYPIKKVSVMLSSSSKKQAAPEGALSGKKYFVEFENGQTISFIGSPEQRLFYTASNKQKPVIEGRFLLEDYVARVIEREGEVRYTVASQALAVLARSWLVQNSPVKEGCYTTIDDSKAQRVLASVAGKEAKKAALFTQDLIISNEAVMYHQAQERPHVFAWKSAVNLTQQNPKMGFDSLLFKTYPHASLAGLYSELDCTQLVAAETWLKNNAHKWRSQLSQEIGFQEPESFTVCQIQNGLANSDQRRLRIYIQGWGKLEHRLSLIHEYLHLAFKNHPNGRNEVLIEKLARQLAGV